MSVELTSKELDVSENSEYTDKYKATQKLRVSYRENTLKKM